MPYGDPLPRSFDGPFLGINDSMSDRQIDERFARVANNVLLANGQIRPRPPIAVHAQGQFPNDYRIISMVDWRPGGVQDQAPAVLFKAVHKTGAFQPGIWTSKVGDIFPTQLTSLGSGGSRNHVTWVVHNDLMYVIDGSFPMYKTDGTVGGTFPIGFLQRPKIDISNNLAAGSAQVYVGNWLDAYATQAPEDLTVQAGLPFGPTRWAFTFYHAKYATESNAQFTGDLTAPFADLTAAGFTERTNRNVHRIYVKWAAFDEFSAHADEVRIYRKDPTSPFYRLVGIALESAKSSFTDPTGQSVFNITIVDVPAFDLSGEAPIGIGPIGQAVPLPLVEDLLSSAVNGPFAPVKNYSPPGATVAMFYGGRMLYAGARTIFPQFAYLGSPAPGINFAQVSPPGIAQRVFYSEFQNPDHVDVLNDFEVLHGDMEDGISGMADLAGQAVISTRKSLHVLSGVIQTSTNATIATGAAPPASTHSLYRTKVRVGAATYHGKGNGLIVAGHPPKVYFASESGFYSFDGVDERQESKLIQNLWRRFARFNPSGTLSIDFKPATERSLQVTYAVDALNEIIFICNDDHIDNHTDPVTDRPVILAFHYGLGNVPAWSTIDVIGVAGTGDDTAHCICSALSGSVEGSNEYALMYIGSDDKILYMDTELTSDEDNDLGMSTVRYETGLILTNDGRRTHVYEATFKYQPVVHGEYVGHAATMMLGYAVNKGKPVLRSRDMLTKKAFARVRVATECDAIRLIIAGQKDIPWNSEFAITGWSLQTEPAGY